MTLSELRYIVAVGQELNFRRAAERCFVSQPALSLAIRKLEDELGVQLFERSKTEVSITSAGVRLIEQSRHILEECDRLKTMARAGQDQLIGPLKLGAIHTVGPYLLPELIPALHRRAPGMPLEIEENTTAALDRLLRNGNLDVAIIALPFEGANIVTRTLYDEAFVVVVPVEHPWAKRKTIDAGELAHEKVLRLASEHCFSNQVAEACPEINRHGTDVLQGNSLETIRNMVASGLGITVLPRHAISPRYDSPRLAVIPFSTPAPSRRIALAWRKSFTRELAIDALAEAIKESMIGSP